jgi:hypothetical protein
MASISYVFVGSCTNWTYGEHILFEDVDVLPPSHTRMPPKVQQELMRLLHRTFGELDVLWEWVWS